MGTTGLSRELYLANQINSTLLGGKKKSNWNNNSFTYNSCQYRNGFKVETHVVSVHCKRHNTSTRTQFADDRKNENSALVATDMHITYLLRVQPCESTLSDRLVFYSGRLKFARTNLNKHSLLSRMVPECVHIPRGTTGRSDNMFRAA